MAEEPSVVVAAEGGVLRITLDRPQVHNAMNERLMREVLVALAEHREDPSLRVALFTGSGNSFCAGADLQWMRRALELSYEETLEDSDLLAELFLTIYEFPLPTIALVNGPAIGGGLGFVAACDVVIAAEEAFFRLSEVRLGLIPACISPYLMRKVGESRCRELMLSGRKLAASEALAIGLAHRVVPRSELEQTAGEYVRHFLGAGPQALRWCKEVIATGGSPREARAYTVEVIAKLRKGPEGQEGMSAFLEKRRPSWRPAELDQP